MGLEHDFPVKEHELPRLHVPAQRLEEWKEVAQDEITRALSHRHSWYNAFKDKVRDGFDMIADKPNLKAFVRPVPDTPDKDILIRSTLEAVTLDDLVAGMYCDSTYDVRCTYAHMYESNFLDAGILQVHERKTDEDPMHFVGMRWIAFRSPAPAIVTSRDFLFFSYEGTAYDVDGNRVLFRFLRSMPMDGIEVDSSHLPPLVRGKISNLHLYRQNGSRVDAFTKAMHSNAGAMPSWIVTKTISFMFPGISNVETVCDARALLAIGMAKLNPGRITHHSSMSSNGSGRSMSNGQSAAVHAAALSLSANACGVCFHKFKMTRAKRRCQGCCREVCKRCTRKMWFFDEMKQIADTGVVALRFCLNCTRQARAEIREATAAERHHHRSSLGTRRSSSAGSASSSTRRTLVRRIPSQPEMEPTEFYHSNRSHHKYADEDLDDDSDSYNPYSNKQQVAPSHIHPLPHQLQQLQQLHHLQQQCGLNQEDHDTFVRLYGQYANRLNMAPQYQQSRGSVESVRPVSSLSHGASGQQLPRSMHRHNSDGVAWSHVAAARSPVSNHRGRRSSSPMHMIPPMPQPDAPSSSRSHMTPLSNSSRQNSAPNLYAYDHNVRAADRLPRTVTASSMSSISSTSSSHATHMSEDLEAIFRLRTMLFDEPQGGDHGTVSTSSTSSAARRPPPHQKDHQRADLIALPPPIVQRY